VVDKVAGGRGFPSSRPTSVFAANIQFRYSVHSDNCVLRFDIDQRFWLVGSGRRKLEFIEICREGVASSFVICRLWDLAETLVGCIWQINSVDSTPVIIYRICRPIRRTGP
jgi:hypothetical protein